MATRSQKALETAWADLSNYTNMNTYGSTGSVSGGVFNGGGNGFDNVTNYRYNGGATIDGQDHYSKATGTSSFLDTTYFYGVTCRQSADVQATSTSSRDGYYAYACADASSGTPHTVRLGKFLNGVETIIATTTTNVTNAGGTITLEVTGPASATRLVVYIDDVEVAALTQAAYNESALATGKPGFMCASSLTLDNHDVGDMVSAVVVFHVEFSKRNRPGRGPLSLGRFAVSRVDAYKLASVEQFITPSGQGSAAVYGTHTISNVSAQSLAPGGIASASVYGTHTIADVILAISPNGQASAAVYGTHTLSLASGVQITPAGIASAAAYGTHTIGDVLLNIAPSGIASARAYGAHVLTGGAAPAPGAEENVWGNVWSNT